MRKVDVAIIGAGSAGLTARREVLKKTDNYVVIDDGILGTTCARVGCMPSKVLIQVANDYHRRHKLLEQGINGSQHLSVDTVKVMRHVRKLRDRFVRGVTGSMESWIHSDKFIAQRASFLDAHTLMVADEKIHAEKIIIATGSRPYPLDILKGFESFLIDTNRFFELDDLPSSIAVIGAGVIGMELGQAMSQLGVETTIIGRRPNLAGISDPELNAYAIKKFSEFLNFSFSGVNSVEQYQDKIKIQSGDKQIIVDKILLANGRKPNLDSLKLENAGIKDFVNGVPIYHPHTFSLLSHKHIFIVGDVNNEKPLLHEASDQGRVAGYNCVNPLKEFRPRTPLFVTFCEPNICKVGLGYQELEQQGREFSIGQVSFEGQGRSIVKLKEMGMLRVYGDKATGELLGAEMMGPDSEHLAHLLSWIIDLGVDVTRALSLPFYHPVIEEGLRTAIRDLSQKCDIIPHPLEINEL